MQSAEVREKSRKTCLKKYGVEVVTQSDIIKEKTKATCMEKYGVEHFAKTEEGRHQRKEIVKRKMEDGTWYIPSCVGREYSDDTIKLMSESHTKYTYISPHGVFKTRMELREFYSMFSKGVLHAIYDRPNRIPSKQRLEEFGIYDEDGTKTWVELGFRKELRK